jgi:hypothetical protein
VDPVRFEFCAIETAFFRFGHIEFFWQHLLGDEEELCPCSLLVIFVIKLVE